jgi:hypothetical protein
MDELGKDYDFPIAQWKHERNKKIAQKRILERRRAEREVKFIPKGSDEGPWDAEPQPSTTSNAGCKRKRSSAEECCVKEKQTLK